MTERLSRGAVARLARAGKVGMFPDGGGLYLQITRSGAAS